MSLSTKACGLILIYLRPAYWQNNEVGTDKTRSSVLECESLSSLKGVPLAALRCSCTWRCGLHCELKRYCNKWGRLIPRCGSFLCSKHHNSLWLYCLSWECWVLLCIKACLSYLSALLMFEIVRKIFELWKSCYSVLTEHCFKFWFGILQWHLFHCVIFF